MTPSLVPPATRAWPPSSWPRPRWPRKLALSAGVRFGVIYAGVFALSILALAVFLWWSTAGLLDRQTEAAINADTQGLLERYRDGGLLALEETIEQRLSDNVDDDAVYLLTDPAMHRLAGNLEHLPIAVLREQGYYELKLERAGGKSTAQVQQLALPGGFHLLVGRDVAVHAQMTRLLTDALLWAAGVAMLLGTLGALAVRGLFRISLAEISATAAAVSAGDLTRRVRVSGRGTSSTGWPRRSTTC